MITNHRCKFCGRLVRLDDERKAVYHAQPTCEKFKALMASEDAFSPAEPVHALVIDPPEPFS